jgi:hypothetical protein
MTSQRGLIAEKGLQEPQLRPGSWGSWCGPVLIHEQPAMTIQSDSDVVTAMQYLMWALEHIEKTGDPKAAHHARLALKALRERYPRSTDTGEHAP